MSRHKPWKVIASTPVYRADPWLAVERQKIELSDGRIVNDYHRITLPDFAGIVAQVEDGRFLITRQYRHGVGRVCLTLPAARSIRAKHRSMPPSASCARKPATRRAIGKRSAASR